MASHEADTGDPFATKGGALFAESLDAMVLTPASRKAIGDAVARGRHRAEQASAAPAPHDHHARHGSSREARAS